MNIGAKIVFICNTYMQLIAAVQMKIALFNLNEVDLMLSDHSSNSDHVVEGVLNTKLFKRVRYVRSKHIFDHCGKLTNIKHALDVSIGVGGRFRKMLWDDMNYDEIFFYNHYDTIPLAIYRISMKNGTIPKAHCYEEGILSYKNMAMKPKGRCRKLIGVLLRCQGKQDIYERIEDYFCFYPELFPNPSKGCCKIPLLDRKDAGFVQLINTVFDYHPDQDIYPQRYIFFASSADIDETPIGETELVLQIAELVGRENLLVKMHPRDDRDVYEKQGITVSRNSAIPWEVIQLNQDFSNHVFLTVSSGSVINASAMLDDKIPTFFLYPLVKGRNAYIDDFCENTVQPTLEKLNSIGSLQSVKIVSDLRDIVF